MYRSLSSRLKFTLVPFFDGSPIKPNGNSDLSYFDDPSVNAQL